MKVRTKVPKKLAAEIEFAVDMRCCVCEPVSGLPPRPRAGQIHHLDSDPTNHKAENLVWLCLDHHEEAGTTGQAARRLSADVIRKYRSVLQTRIQRNRVGSKIQNAQPGSGTAFIEALDALVVFDLRKLQLRAGAKWETTTAVLAETAGYPEPLGFVAKQAILDYLADLARRTRSQMPVSVAEAIRSIAIATCDLYFLHTHAKKKINKSDGLLREIVADIGKSMVYDDSLYLRSLPIVEAGGEILWRLLASAVIMKDGILRKAVLEGFDAGIDGAARGPVADAEKVLSTFRNHGLKGGVDYPVFTRDLVFRMLDARTAASK